MRNLKQIVLPLILASVFAAAVPAMAADPAAAPSAQTTGKYVLHIEGMT